MMISLLEDTRRRNILLRDLKYRIKRHGRLGSVGCIPIVILDTCIFLAHFYFVVDKMGSVTLDL